MKTRKPAVAGRFYPARKSEIINLLSTIYKAEEAKIDVNLIPKNILGGVVPHAGYIYSAYQAIHFFEILKLSKIRYDTIFILNPNHSGAGSEISLDDNDEWETPLGKTQIDKSFYELLNFEISERAHKYEHSGEVMLPLLQYSLDYDFKILPISILKQNFNNSQKIAKSIIEANKILRKKILLIASSDFSHYVDPDEGILKDEFVVNEILKLNSEGIYKQIREKDISVCGYGPIMSLIEYSKIISPNPLIKVLRRGHSGEVYPSHEVVDYISILFYEENN